MPRKRKRSRVRIPLDKKGSLTRHGYSTKCYTEPRRRALVKAIRSLARTKKRTQREAAVTVVKRLTALRTLNKNKNKRRSDIFRTDAKWVKKYMYGSYKGRLKYRL